MKLKIRFTKILLNDWPKTSSREMFPKTFRSSYGILKTADAYIRMDNII